MCAAVAVKARRKSCLDVRADLFGTLASHEGTLGVVDAEALGDSFRCGVEKDYGAAPEHEVHVVEEAGCASAASYYDIVEFTRLMEHRLLAASENILSFGVEHQPDGGMETLLDIEIKVDEGSPRVARESLAEGRLAARHISY